MPVKPKRLKQGDTIGVISPASPITENHSQAFDKGIFILQDMGYNVIFGKHVFSNAGYLAGKDFDRAQDLTDMFNNKDVNAIICSRGGYGCAKLIDHLDFELVRSNPKIFIGYSDISFLLNIFFHYSGIICFHGPMVFNLKDTDNNASKLFDTITLYRSSYVINSEPCPGLYSSNFKAVGRLIGGNLQTITGLLGTRFDMNMKDCILFIEEIKEKSYSIDRLLTHLKNSRKLADCSGFILGDFTDCEESNGVSCWEVLKEILLPFGKPILYSFQSGHGKQKLTLPIGALVEIDAKNGYLNVIENVID